MSESNPGAQVVPVEMLTEMEGPALHEPGVLFDEAQIEHLEIDGDVAALAAWIGVTAISGTIDGPAHEAIQKKVRGVLAAWRQRFGQAKIDEVKQQVWLQMQQYRNKRKLTDDELQQRIDLLFRSI
jgi:hypothetical protein